MWPGKETEITGITGKLQEKQSREKKNIEIVQKKISIFSNKMLLALVSFLPVKFIG